MSKITAIVLAAGMGSRMQENQKKQFIKICGRPVLWYSLNAFEKSLVDEIILVTAQCDIAYCKTNIIDLYGFQKVKQIVAGGSERYHSVYNGLQVVTGDIVLIHDGARPIISEELIHQNIKYAQKYDACVTGISVKDTIKIVENKTIVETLNRNTLMMIQTPQSFKTDLIKGAYQKLMNEKNVSVTDDAGVVERYTDTPVHIVSGDYKNIKITTTEDLAVAETFLKRVFKRVL